MKLILLTFIFFSLQVFWRMNYGNGELYIQNEDSDSAYDTEVLINGKVIETYNFYIDDINPHRINLGTKIGNKKIKVLRKDNQYSIETEINTQLVRWVIIRIYDDEDINIKYTFIPPVFQ